ncbi:MAG: DUF3990 domain-containing protein [Erysipelotrichaceae bacterium]|nr:DUF3990 domain-containing protein [Erysipelotrichaceae bacterium]
MDYLIYQDVESVMELADVSADDLANELGVSRVTVSHWMNNRNAISAKHMEQFYSYVYQKGIRLNRIKEQLYREDVVSAKEKLLFHGAKTKLEGNLRTDCSKKINDFGNGFYCGESLEQSATFVAAYESSSLYMLTFHPEGLVGKTFCCDREWMLTIAYFRGKLEEYKDTEQVRQIAKTKENIDYIVAPIADNRMYEIIDSFIEGEITDVQCQHCLSATNLGMQYVFVSEKALSQVTLLERCYLSGLEKEDYLKRRNESFRMNMDKMKLARKQYRNQGEYIEDIMR